MKKINEQKARKAMTEFLNAEIELASLQAGKRKRTTEIVQEFEPLEKMEIDKKKDAAEIIEAYANQEREALFTDGKKSTEFAGGKIGFKTSPAKLESGNWEETLEYFKTNLSEYVIEKCELDKKGILRNIDLIGGETLDDAALTVSQEEKFFVKA